MPHLLLVLCLLSPQDRTPVPEPAAQQSALKLLRELYAVDYAKKSPADQKALAEKLLLKGFETLDDPVSRFVLLSEARETAAAGADTATVVRASDELARLYAVDGISLKIAALNRIASGIRDPEAARACARAFLASIPQAIRAENFDAASLAAQRAETLAKSAQDAGLARRAGDLRTDVLSLKTEAARTKALIEKASPADAEAIGRYLCFIVGDWETGLPLLRVGAKGALKLVLDKETAPPADAAKKIEVAEAWAELAQKEKSEWRQGRLLARARHWFELALPEAGGLLRLKVERRLAELEPMEAGTVNLLPLIDLKLDALVGEWTMEGGALVSPSQPWARLQIPYVPPEEYELTVVAERRQGDNAVLVGLAKGSTPFALLLDSYPGLGGRSGLDILDAIFLDRSPAALPGRQAPAGRPITILTTVRRSGVTVTLDGKPLISFPGPYSRLSPSPAYAGKDNRLLFVGAFDSRIHFSRLVLSPLSGQGKKLR